MPDDRTPTLSLPLPHPDHRLDEDVLRLRAALTGVDAAFVQQSDAIDQTLTEAQAQVDQSLEATTTEITRMVRLMRLNDLLGLGI